MKSNSRLIVTFLTLLVILLATVGVLGWLWYLHGAETRSAAEVQANEAERQQLQQMEAEIRDLQTRQKGQAPGASDAATQAQEDRLKQQRELIAGQLALAQGELKDAQDLEKRTREAGTAFLGLFAILAAAVVGQGYLNLFEFKKQSDEQLEKLEKTTEKFDNKVQDLENANKELLDSKTVVTAIRSSWESLDDKIPAFTQDAKKLLAREQDLRQSEQLAVMQELDAFTYLYPRMRFGEKKKDYYESLLQIVRGQIVKGEYQQALRRLQCLIDEGESFIAPEEFARAHAYRGNIKRLLAERSLEQRPWVIEANRDEVRELVKGAWDAFEAADKKRKIPETSFYRGQFYRFLTRAKPHINLADYGITGGDEECHRKSAAEYERLLDAYDFLNRHAVLQNLACELKLVAECTGNKADLQRLGDTLEAHYPTQTELDKEYKTLAADKDRRPLLYLWQSILEDEDLFASLSNVPVSDYEKMWRDILNKKARQGWIQDLRTARQNRANWILQ